MTNNLKLTNKLTYINNGKQSLTGSTLNNTINKEMSNLDVHFAYRHKCDSFSTVGVKRLLRQFQESNPTHHSLSTIAHAIA